METTDSNESVTTTENETTTDSNAIYELRDLNRHFKTGDRIVKAVDNVNLTIQPGEFISIQGPSGSGKTTLLQLLGMLDKPTSGQLIFDGGDITKLNDRELTALRAHDLGFVFQQFNLIPTLTAEENVVASLSLTQASRAKQHERATELLNEVGLAERFDHLPTKLSGGEQQRVAIARALANRPRVIMADEPTGNLDTTTAKEIIDLLSQLCAKEGVTIILITHDEEIGRRAQRQLRMRDGVLAEQN